MPKNKRILIFSVLFATAIVGVTLATIISNLLYSPASGMASGINSPSTEIHFISLNKSQVESSALALAEDSRQIGAGGFVWKTDEYYHIFSSGFENRNDAVLVQNNLTASSITSEIVSIKFDGIEISGSFEAEEKKVLQKAVNSFISTYKYLYDIAISLDTAVYNEISARLAVNSAHSNLTSIKADFDILFNNTEVASIKTLSSALNKAETCLTALCSGKLLSRNQTYSSLIKYRYIELLSIYQNLNTQLKKSV